MCAPRWPASKRRRYPTEASLLIGLMNVDGDPMVVEYNVRLGDPETEVVVPRIASDMVDLLEGIADQTLAVKKVRVDERAAGAVMVVSEGYPGKYETGKPISGLDKIDAEAVVFHAGTRRDADTGMVYTAGGRVLATMAFGADLRQAVGNALEQLVWSASTAPGSALTLAAICCR